VLKTLKKRTLTPRSAQNKRVLRSFVGVEKYYSNYNVEKNLSPIAAGGLPEKKIIKILILPVHEYSS